MRSGRLVGLMLCAALAGATGCGGGGGGGGGSSSGTPTGPGNTPPPPTTTNTVTVGSASFSPASITVTKGSTVTWTWDSCTGGDVYGSGQTCVAHNVTLEGSAGASATQSSGSWAHAFPNAGTFNYQCTIHGATMSGKVVVQ